MVYETVVVVIGAILILIAIGGGKRLKIEKIEVGNLTKIQRSFIGILGAFILIIGIWQPIFPSIDKISIESGVLIITLVVLFLTLVVFIWQTRELKKSTQIQAYQSVLANYIGCITEQGEPLYKNYFKNLRVDDKDINLFAALLNTFEMLYVQKDQKIISDDVWIPWKNYFTELINGSENYKKMWEALKERKIYHQGLIEIINKEVIT